MRQFMPFADARTCRVTKDDEFSLEMSPAECAKAMQAVGIALSMQSMDPLPSHIKCSPFIIRFHPDDTLALERRSEQGSIPFSWEQGDDLIVAIQDAEAMAINERVLVQSPRGAYTESFNEEPF